jgi:hypothetical protein
MSKRLIVRGFVKQTAQARKLRQHHLHYLFDVLSREMPAKQSDVVVTGFVGEVYLCDIMPTQSVFTVVTPSPLNFSSTYGTSFVVTCLVFSTLLLFDVEPAVVNASP